MSINFIIAQILGLIALIVLIISFQKNDKKFLLKFQTISSLLYALQYAFFVCLYRLSYESNLYDKEFYF